MAGGPRTREKQGHSVTLFLPVLSSGLVGGIRSRPHRFDRPHSVGAHTVEGSRAAEPAARIERHSLPDRPASLFRPRRPLREDGRDYDDNCERFVFFDRAVLETIQALDLQPDIIHCNDWQTGLIPVYLRTFISAPRAWPVGTLLTIHNLAYLGLFWHWDMTLTGLDWRLFQLATARVSRQALLHESRAWCSPTCSARSARLTPRKSRRPASARDWMGCSATVRPISGESSMESTPRHGVPVESRCSPALTTDQRRTREGPSARRGFSGEPGSPSGPTSRCSRRSGGSTLKRAGTCWRRWPIDSAARRAARRPG